MIILNLKCGLGNQLFEYAYARSLMHKLKNKKIYLKMQGFENDTSGRTYKLDNFKLNEDTQLFPARWQSLCTFSYEKLAHLVHYIHLKKGRPTEELIEKFLKVGIYSWNFEDIEDVYKGKIHYLEGVFQNYHRFDHLRDELRECFTHRNPPSTPEAQMYLDKISQTEAVAMHVRRGDYVDDPRWSQELLICTENYYREAFEQAKKDIPGAVFYVFSNTPDDLAWIKEHYTFLNCPEVVFVDCGGDDIEDFRLLKSCKHHVMSNSSFSWWAQYLCDNPNQKVYAPKYWDSSRTAYSGIYMDHWKCIAP